MRQLISFIKDEDGMGTVEMVIIVAVLVGIALLFRQAIFGFVEETVKNVFGDPSVQDLKTIPKSTINQ